MSETKIPKGYKRTEVGVIPQEWDTPLLDTISQRGSGHTPDKKHPEYWNGEIHWISLKDSEVLDSLFIEDTVAKITPLGIANSSATVHPCGTVVMSRDAGVGKSAIMKIPMAVSQHFMAWVCGGQLFNHFLYYLLQFKKPEFERIAMGNTIKTIGLSYFRAFRIQTPPLPEQRAIATALSDVDALIAGLDQLIAKKRDIKQAAIQQLLTGQKRLPGFQIKSGYKHTEVGVIPEVWDVVPLRGIGKFEKGIGLLKEDLKSAGSTPAIPYTALYTDFSELLSYDHIKWFVDDASRTYIVSEPCLLIASSSNMEANTGKASALTGKIPVAIGREIIIFKTDSNCNFISYLLSTPLYRRKTLSLARGTTIKHLYPATFLTYKIALPPFFEQTAIANILSDMDSELTALEQRRDKTRALKQGMMQELLTGKTRLVPSV